MSAEVWIRTRTIANTDPQRRCYNGCNFSERVVLGEWRLFQTWDTVEFAERVANSMRCTRQELEVREI